MMNMNNGLAGLIKNVLMSKDKYMNILSRDEKILITVKSSDLYISVSITLR